MIRTAIGLNVAAMTFIAITLKPTEVSMVNICASIKKPLQRSTGKSQGSL